MHSELELKQFALRIKKGIIDAIGSKGGEHIGGSLDLAELASVLYSVENANIIRGVGSAVAQVVCTHSPIPIEKVGIKDVFGQVGNEQFLRQQYHLECKDVVNAVLKILNRK